jgi:hypothetical protein
VIREAEKRREEKRREEKRRSKPAPLTPKGAAPSEQTKTKNEERSLATLGMTRD